MLKTNPMERPYIYSVLENVHDVITKIEGRIWNETIIIIVYKYFLSRNIAFLIISNIT